MGGEGRGGEGVGASIPVAGPSSVTCHFALHRDDWKRGWAASGGRGAAGDVGDGRLIRN